MSTKEEARKKVARLRKLLEKRKYQKRSTNWLCEEVGLTWATVDRVRTEVEKALGLKDQIRVSKNGKVFKKSSFRPKLTMERILGE